MIDFMFLFLILSESTIEFTASEATVKPGVTEKLTVLCQLKDIKPTASQGLTRPRDIKSQSRDKTGDHVTAEWDISEWITTFDAVRWVLSIKIYHGDETVAFVDDYNAPRDDYDRQDGVHVKGHVSGPPGGVRG